MEHNEKNLTGVNLSTTSVKKDEMPNAVNLIIIKKGEDGENYFLFGKRAMHKSGGGQLGLVGGTQAVDETMEETAVREAYEEIGITIKEEDLIWNNFAQILAAPGVTFLHHAFVVTKFEGEPENMEPNKCDGLYWVSESQLRSDIETEEGLAKYFVSFVNMLNYFDRLPYNPKNNFYYRGYRGEKNKIRTK